MANFPNRNPFPHSDRRVWVELTRPLRFHFPGAACGSAAAQGLLATAGPYLVWNWELSQMPASNAVVFLNLEPMVGTILGVIILHERLGPTQAWEDC